MGDRAVFVCHRSRSKFSPAVYVHWQGHAAKSLLESAAPRMRTGDTSYSAARLCGVIHEQSDGNCGLGLLGPPTDWTRATSRAFSHGDAGVFLIDVDTGLVECFNGYGFDDSANDNDEKMSITISLAPNQ